MRTLTVSGAKNAALPLVISKLLVDGPTDFYRHPYGITDLVNCLASLGRYGVRSEQHSHYVTLTTKALRNDFLDDEHASQTRYSSLFLGPLATLFGEASVALPGGCNLGSRPLDIHCDCFRSFGYKILHHDRKLTAIRESDRGGTFRLRYPSVGGTLNFLLLSAIGVTTRAITNAAQEPEIDDVISFLNSAGARIQRRASDIEVQGVSSLRALRWTVMPDRIEVLTYVVLAMLTRIDLQLKGVRLGDLEAPLAHMVDMGLSYDYTAEDATLSVYGSRVDRIRPAKISFDVFPNAPTDAQPLFAALCSAADGVSHLEDKVFPQRFQYSRAFADFGVRVQDEGLGRVSIHPPSVPERNQGRKPRLRIHCPDLRSGAAILLLALRHEAPCVIAGFSQVRRGYSRIVETLSSINVNTSHILLQD